jgi:hypothetical protein
VLDFEGLLLAFLVGVGLGAETGVRVLGIVFAAWRVPLAFVAVLASAAKAPLASTVSSTVSSTVTSTVTSTITSTVTSTVVPASSSAKLLPVSTPVAPGRSGFAVLDEDHLVPNSLAMANSNCLVGFFLGAHLDEAEAVSVFHSLHKEVVDCADLFEEFSEIFFVGLNLVEGTLGEMPPMKRRLEGSGMSPPRSPRAEDCEEERLLLRLRFIKGVMICELTRIYRAGHRRSRAIPVLS